MLTFQVIPSKVFVEGELVTIDKLNQLGAPTIQVLDDNLTVIVADYSVTTNKLADGVLSADTAGRAKMADQFVTAAKLNNTQDWSGKTFTGNPTVTWTGAVNFSTATFTPPPGHQIQAAATGISSVVSAATNNLSIAAGALDNTVPQSTEGVNLSGLNTTITPKSATNILEIEAFIPIGINNAAGAPVIALFQDSTLNALAAATIGNGTNSSQGVLHLVHRMLAGTTSATTFKVNIDVTAGTIYTNANSAGTGVFGGVSKAWLRVREIQA